MVELLQLPSTRMVKDDRQKWRKWFLSPGEKEDELSTELTLEELKAAFRYRHSVDFSLEIFSRLFDDLGEGFITVSRFRVSYSFINTPYFLSNFQAILKEIDEDFTDDEIDDIILDVSFTFIPSWNY